MGGNYSWWIKTLKGAAALGAQAQLGRHCGPHSMVRLRHKGPRVAFGGCVQEATEAAEEAPRAAQLGGGVTTSVARAAGEPWGGRSG